jgi:hypothetical protein
MASLMGAARSQHWAALKVPVSKMSTNQHSQWQPRQPKIQLQETQDSVRKMKMANPLQQAAICLVTATNTVKLPRKETADDAISNEAGRPKLTADEKDVTRKPGAGVRFDESCDVSGTRSASASEPQSARVGGRSHTAKRLWLASKASMVRSRAATDGLGGLKLADFVLDAMFWNLSCDVNGLMDSPERLFSSDSCA